jgi:diguanylate cyclase (GGDEF)-like protein
LLVIDDDVQSILLLKHILDGCAEIFFATSGEEGLRRVRQDPPDLVLLDAEMPGMSGLQVCAAIRADASLDDLPVIFVTMHHGAEAETRALDAGAVDFIPKPVNPTVARARVRTHLALKARTDELRRLGEMDGLTRLANRRVFDRVLTVEWRRALRAGTALSLLMVDVDHFKRFNDAHGHLQGDACLVQVAQVLAGTARRAGDVVARYGGEEFGVILPGTDAAGARRVGEMLCARMQALGVPHGDSPVSPHVTISVGGASLQMPHIGDFGSFRGCAQCTERQGCRTTPHALLDLADQALYAAKRAGRARMECLQGLFTCAMAPLVPLVSRAMPPLLPSEA